MDTPLAIRKLICSYYEEGYSQRKIAQFVKSTQASVFRVLKKYKATGEATSNRKGNCKRPFILNQRQMRQLRRCCLEDPCASARQIQSKLGGIFSNLSVRSVQRYLRRVNCFPFRPLNCPTLTGKQRIVRHKWAKKHKFFDFSNVLFSDETYIQLQPNNVGRFVRREKYLKSSIKLTKPHRPFLKKLLIWGCIHQSGPGNIEIIRGSMDSIRYREILEKNVIPFADTFSHFQHDNAPPHKAIKTQQLIERSELSLLTWPPYSPDANPIENIWAILKERVRSRSPTTLEALEEAIKDVWVHDKKIKDACKSVIDSMPKRMRGLCTSRGGFINY